MEWAGNIVKTLEERKTPKKLNIKFYPNAPESQIVGLLNNAKVAYLPFDRGADFHSRSLPTCILMDTAIVTTKGNDTPANYLENLIFANDVDKASNQILQLMQNTNVLS